MPKSNAPCPMSTLVQPKMLVDVHTAHCTHTKNQDKAPNTVCTWSRAHRCARCVRIEWDQGREQRAWQSVNFGFRARRALIDHIQQIQPWPKQSAPPHHEILPLTAIKGPQPTSITTPQHFNWFIHSVSTKNEFNLLATLLTNKFKVFWHTSCWH